MKKQNLSLISSIMLRKFRLRQKNGFLIKKRAYKGKYILRKLYIHSFSKSSWFVSCSLLIKIFVLFFLSARSANFSSLKLWFRHLVCCMYLARLVLDL